MSKNVPPKTARKQEGHFKKRKSPAICEGQSKKGKARKPLILLGLRAVDFCNYGLKKMPRIFLS